MQGLITIDFGNTHPHAGLFQKSSQGWQLLKVVPFNELPIYLEQLQMSANNSSVVLSEVKARPEDLQPLIEQGFLLTRITDYWRGEKFAGMPVNYAKTLGEDRLIEAFYTYKIIKAPTLLIDAGTYVTMDVVTKDGFLGGYIIPGLETYFNTFQRGERLKDVALEHDFSLTLPKTTNQAMTESYTAFASLARELIRNHHLTNIILTGGKAEVWKNILTSSSETIGTEVHPHLIHTALHHWFTTQIEPL